MFDDPFLDKTNSIRRLLEEYEKHGSLVVAVDFDQTLFDYHQLGYQFPRLIQLIKESHIIGFKVVVFSGSAKERHPFIESFFIENLGFKPDGINCDVVDWHKDKSLDWSRSKIFYNILLDDRAGLGESFDILNKVINHIKVLDYGVYV